MRKLISFMHISLDGYVAGPNGEMDWIKVDDEIFDFVAKRIGESDTAMYGRVTYEMMESYWPIAADKPNASKHDREHSKWYKDVEKIVLSTTLQGDFPKTKIINDHLAELIHRIKSEAGSDILLFGSPSATHSLIRQNLINGYWLFVNPIVLGSGIPLFVDINEKINLKLLSTHQFTNGVTELNYITEK